MFNLKSFKMKRMIAMLLTMLMFCVVGMAYDVGTDNPDINKTSIEMFETQDCDVAELQPIEVLTYQAQDVQIDEPDLEWFNQTLLNDEDVNLFSERVEVLTIYSIKGETLSSNFKDRLKDYKSNPFN